MRAPVVAVGGLEQWTWQVVDLDIDHDSGGVPDLADYAEGDLSWSVEDAVVS